MSDINLWIEDYNNRLNALGPIAKDEPIPLTDSQFKELKQHIIDNLMPEFASDSSIIRDIQNSKGGEVHRRKIEIIK